MDTYRWLYDHGYMEHRWERRSEGLDAILTPCRVLEVGAGRGQVMRQRQAMGWDWVGCDPVGMPGVQAAGLPQLPYPDGSFDATVSMDVLEHLEPAMLDDCLLELRRVAPRGVHAVADISDIQTVMGQRVELHLIQEPASWWAGRIERLGGHVVVHPTISLCRFWLDIHW